MKKITSIFGAILFASIIFTSCGSNSIDSDAKKYAELTIKVQKMTTEGAAKAATGDMSGITESAKLGTEVASFALEMQRKYKDPSDYQKFTAAYLKALQDCK